MGTKIEKTENIHFRVTPMEKQMLQDKADRAGLSLSEYLLRQGLSRKVTVVPHDLFAEYKLMSAELGRLGNNMNQIAKHLNSGYSGYHVVQWFDQNRIEVEDTIMKLKMLYEKKMIA